ncbi:hypothetical protein ACP93_02455 [Xanthomonas sp. NCPPB 1128]|uniref:hypothetical protein n=1 Tax=Xanthomonas sp. NCPPB 1128 TaxID=1775876 RepID=UPI00065AC340|nr:hypothetical protein [Xanthomonas sp. NCPPB 1128]KMM77046.1 hypothetical protein ACP93_02190 [Xanthomonas sp. NCPPB 1128]KMM77090.1 hypothetical protein ACP93_02455 [Xanthomonas sp. NCPPB 1128]
MIRPFTRRAPRRNGGFSWGRVLPSEQTVTYRLFRRDLTGALHCSMHTFHAATPRRAIANDLRRARHKLRDRVDEIDLATMGITA